MLRVLSALLCIGSVCIVVHWLKCKLGKAGIQVHKMARGPWPRRAGSCPRSSTRPPSRGHGPRALGDLRASSSFHSFHFVVSFMNLRSKTCTSDMASAAHRSHRSRTATKSSWSHTTRSWAPRVSLLDKVVHVVAGICSLRRSAFLRYSSLLRVRVRTRAVFLCLGDPSIGSHESRLVTPWPWRWFCKDCQEAKDSAAKKPRETKGQSWQLTSTMRT